jgi:hypothetical protein
MNTVSYTSIQTGILRNLSYDPTSTTETTDRLKADIAELVTQAMDSAWHWCIDGWPELRKALSRTAVASVISLSRATSIDPIGQVLNVTERHPWTSVNPSPVPFSVSGDGIMLNDDVGSTATVYVSYLKPAPKYTSADWVTATAYVVGDLVQSSGFCYECLTAHTSGTFATDLAAAKWEVQDVPAFLSTPIKTAVTAAMRETNGQTQRMQVISQILDRQLSTVAERYDFSRTGGAQRVTSCGYN